MKKVTILMLLATLVGCATGYQKYTWSGGYKDEKIGDNHFKVEYYGNGTTSRETVSAFWEKRAFELCPSGYDIVSAEGGANNGGIFIGVNVDHPWKKAEIRCR